MKRIVLRKEDCYKSITDFYDHIAELEGKIAEGVQYDVRKICCTKGVQEGIFQFYKDEGYEQEEITAVWLGCGPKANLEGNDFIVTMKDGFFLI